MDIAHLQALGGWADLTIMHYPQMTDDDLLQAHQEHSPIDRLVGRPAHITRNVGIREGMQRVNRRSPRPAASYGSMFGL